MPDRVLEGNVSELPVSRDAELDVLAALLIDQDVFAAIDDTFDPGLFRFEPHRDLAGEVRRRIRRGESMNPADVYEALAAAGKRKAARLATELVGRRVVTSTAPLRWQVVRETAKVRGRKPDPLGMVERPCDTARLREREKMRFIPLGTLPERHGWGDFLDKLTGGGIAPGSIVGLGAAGTGAGKTAFLMQLLDGLALRSADIAADPDASLPLTPIMVASEMDKEDLECRTLGRLLDVPGHVFAAGESAKRFHRWGWVEEQFNRAEALMLPDGLYGRLVRWQRVARPRLSGPALVHAIEQHADAWIESIRQANPGRDVVPIIAVDPVNRFLPLDGRNEVETLGEIATLLDELADRKRWIIVVTADTNKTAAKEPDEAPGAASVFRGTMQLLHAFDLTLVLSAAEPDPDGVCVYSVLVDKNRHGRNGVTLQFRWHTRTGLRFVPETEDEWRVRTGSRPGQDQDDLRLRLVELVAELVKAGVRPSRRSLRPHAKDLGVTRDALEAIVDRCIVEGELTEERVGGRGGGTVLVPTGKGLPTGDPAELAEASGQFAGRTHPATSGQSGRFDVTDGKDSETNRPDGTGPEPVSMVTESEATEGEIL